MGPKRRHARPGQPLRFALLPAWITSTIATGGTDAVLVRLARALRTGTVLTIGFTGTLTLAGMAISAGARPLVTAAPWLGITIGLTLAMLGVFMLTGRTIGLRMPARMRHWPNSPAAGGVLAAGIGYALASLSCTFAVLLAVIAQAQATSGWGGWISAIDPQRSAARRSSGGTKVPQGRATVDSWVASTDAGTLSKVAGDYRRGKAGPGGD